MPHLRRAALWLSLGLLLLAPVVADATPAAPPPIPGGFYNNGQLMGGMVEIIGYDSITGLPCHPTLGGTCVTGSSSGGSVTAASGAFVTGSIVDIGTASSPAAGTVNAQLAAIDTILTTMNASVNSGVITLGSAVPSTALYEGGLASSTEPTKATTGNGVGALKDLAGKEVTSPYAQRELFVRGTASTTAGTATTLIANSAASVKLYITGAQCGNSSATTVNIVLNDTETTGSGTSFICPAGFGNNPRFDPPLVVAAATALTFTASSGVTTITVNAQGYLGY